MGTDLPELNSVHLHLPLKSCFERSDHTTEVTMTWCTTAETNEAKEKDSHISLIRLLFPRLSDSSSLKTTA